MNKIAMVLKIILLLAVIGIIGFVAYSCFFNQKDATPKTDPTVPAMDIAPYQVTVKATGNIYYSKLVVTAGDTVGDRVFTLKGYWEQIDGKYVFKDITVPLKESEFGEITVERRK
ncbi:MAG: hypothetical protein IMZ64_10695 [Bacteroidetes bacterium]|nr:hypothetical protein [Bacteroidota bacterium]